MAQQDFQVRSVNDMLLGYAEHVTITQEEYEQAEKDLPADEFKKFYKQNKERFLTAAYQKLVLPTEKDLNMAVLLSIKEELERSRRLQDESTQSLSTIKSIMIFNLIISLASAIMAIVAIV